MNSFTLFGFQKESLFDIFDRSPIGRMTDVFSTAFKDILNFPTHIRNI